MSTNLPYEMADNEVVDEPTDDELPDGVTVNGTENVGTQELGQSGNVDIDPALQEIQSQESSGLGKTFNLLNSYEANGKRYQKVQYKGINETGYRTADGNRIDEQEFLQNIPESKTESKATLNGEQYTQFKLDDGSVFYQTALAGDYPSMDEVQQTDWANAGSREVPGDIKPYTQDGRSNAVIMTPDGLQRTTREEIQNAMQQMANYKQGGSNRAFVINGTMYKPSEFEEIMQNNILPNTQIFIYDNY